MPRSGLVHRCRTLTTCVCSTGAGRLIARCVLGSGFPPSLQRSYMHGGENEHIQHEYGMSRALLRGAQVGAGRVQPVCGACVRR